MSSYTVIGSNSSNTSAASITNVTTATANVGSIVILRATMNGGAAPAGLTVGDTAGGNTWTLAIDQGDGSALYAVVYYSVLATQIPSGGTITMSWTTAQTFRAMDSIMCTNPAGTPLDSPPTKGAFSSGGPSTAASTGTAVSPATSDWVAVFAVSIGTTSVTPQAGWTEDHDISAIGWETQTLIGTNTTAISGAGTLSGIAGWSCVVAVFKLTTAVSLRPRPLLVRQAVQRAGVR